METDLKQMSYAYMSTAPSAQLAPVMAQPTPAPVLLLNSNGKCLYQLLAQLGSAAPSPPLGRVAQRMSCPNCHNMMQTHVERRANRSTHLFALALCLTGLVCLVPLPYCLKSCCSLDHYCSNCNQYIGKAVF